MSLTNSQKHVVAAIAAMVFLLVASVVIGAWLIDKRDNAASPATSSAPVPALTSPTEVQNTTSSPDANQPCNYLDYEGDPKDPDHIILWCDAGQTALVIKTKGLERYVWKDGMEGSTGNGSHHLDVRAGNHFAYNLAIVQLEDGSVDFRVWYDDKQVTHERGDKYEATRYRSRITMRNFTAESLAQTRSLGYN